MLVVTKIPVADEERLAELEELEMLDWDDDDIDDVRSILDDELDELGEIVARTDDELDVPDATMYMFKRLGPPQSSPELPAHTILQLLTAGSLDV